MINLALCITKGKWIIICKFGASIHSEGCVPSFLTFQFCTKVHWMQHDMMKKTHFSQVWNRICWSHKIMKAKQFASPRKFVLGKCTYDSINTVKQRIKTRPNNAPAICANVFKVACVDIHLKNKNNQHITNQAIESLKKKRKEKQWGTC